MISVRDSVRILNVEKECERLSKLMAEMKGSLDRLWEVARAEQISAEPKRKTLGMPKHGGKAD